MDFGDLIKPKDAPEKRRAYAQDGIEHHFYEGLVMLAFAFHLLQKPSCTKVTIHPDGEHGKQFDIALWLVSKGFVRTPDKGKTSYGGTYRDDLGRTIVVFPKSGLGDVVATDGDVEIMAECKGGIVNTRHAGQVSRLKKGLSEVVGQLMSIKLGGRQIAVVPHTKTTEAWARKLEPRCTLAGIKIALVHSTGEVQYI